MLVINDGNKCVMFLCALYNEHYHVVIHMQRKIVLNYIYYNLLKFAPIKKIMPFISVTITAGLTSDPTKFRHVSINLNNSYLNCVTALLF